MPSATFSDILVLRRTLHDPIERALRGLVAQLLLKAIRLPSPGEE